MGHRLNPIFAWQRTMQIICGGVPPISEERSDHLESDDWSILGLIRLGTKAS